jgi:hypothetical protein
MRDVKELADAIGGRTLAEVSDAVPGPLLGTAYQAESRQAAPNRGRILANTTVTNVPGPTHPLYFEGARVVGPYGAGPFPHGMGLIHLVGSYAGQITFSFTREAPRPRDVCRRTACFDRRGVWTDRLRLSRRTSVVRHAAPLPLGSWLTYPLAAKPLARCP